MSASPAEMVQMYLIGSEKTLPALSKLPVASYKNLFDLAAEYQIHFGDHVAAARIQWRHKLKDPRPTLRVAMQLARDLADKLQALKAPDLGKQVLKVSSALAVGYLLENSYDKKLLAILPDFAAWKKHKTTRSYIFPDVGLILALESGAIPGDWEEMLESVRRGRTDIFVESYRCYMDIIKSALQGSRSETIANIKQASVLYDRRRGDRSYRYFASNEGGGEFADYMADHRLAAIIKHCRQLLPRLAIPRDIVHVWRW